MTKMKTLVLGLVLLSLLAVGLIAVAGNGAGGSTAAAKPGSGTYMQTRDADGDGIPNCSDPDWTRPLDGTGFGAHHGNGSGPHDGTGQGARRGMGLQHGYGNGVRAGGCTK